jgi:hypothetical protein
MIKADILAKIRYNVIKNECKKAENPSLITSKPHKINISTPTPEKNSPVPVTSRSKVWFP